MVSHCALLCFQLLEQTEREEPEAGNKLSTEPVSPVTHEASSQSCRVSRRWPGWSRPRYRTSLKRFQTSTDMIQHNSI